MRVFYRGSADLLLHKNWDGIFKPRKQIVMDTVIQN